MGPFQSIPFLLQVMTSRVIGLVASKHAFIFLMARPVPMTIFSTL